MKILATIAAGFILQTQDSIGAESGEDESRVELADPMGVGNPQNDPCFTFCVNNSAGDCTKVRSSNGLCSNLCLESPGKPIVCLSPDDRVNFVSLNVAFASVSPGGSTCSNACILAALCPESYCKSNNHCHGLFWDERYPASICYHTEATPCRPMAPVHCAYIDEVETLTPSRSTESPVREESVVISPKRLNILPSSAEPSIDPNTGNTVDSESTLSTQESDLGVGSKPSTAPKALPDNQEATSTKSTAANAGYASLSRMDAAFFVIGFYLIGV